MNVEKYALTTQTYGVPFICTMKKYTRTKGRTNRVIDDESAPGSILLLANGSGFPKETWEATISELYKIDTDRETRPIIREIWALDCQSHGEAAILNEDVLVRHPGILTIWDYAEAFATLFRSGLLGKLDPKLHQVVLCGHSAGSIAVTLATSFFNPPSRIPFAKIILVDPPIWSKNMEGLHTEMFKTTEAVTPVRRDIWENMDHATQWLKKRLPGGSWDDRVFDAQTKYGLRTLPTAFYPDKTGVTLTTHRSCENSSFTGIKFIYNALDRLNQICAHIPVHLIYGGKHDMFTRELQDSIFNEQEGRTFASVTRLSQDIGHL
ncbi:hypothetical protein HYPSUDRAFT_80835, partial [Hypholoma sublateritium FD-334 SS-4]